MRTYNTTIRLSCLVALLVVGCSRTPSEIDPEVSGPKPGSASSPIVGGDGQDVGTSQNINVGEGQSALMFPVSERELLECDLDTSNLSYRFKYLSVDREGTLNFTNGKATLNFTGLQHSQAGDLLLEIREGGVVKLSGKKENLTLRPGNNNETITLLPVGDSKLNIELIIGQGNQQQDQNQSQNDLNPLNPDQNAQPPQNQNQLPQNQQPQLPPEIANWDGLSDRPSSKWRIVDLPVGNLL